jgi:hypothetical protein
MSQLKQEVNKNKLIDIKKENLKKLKKVVKKKKKYQIVASILILKFFC